MEKYDIVAIVIALVAFLGSFIGLTEKVMKPLKESIEEATKTIRANTDSINKFNTDIAVLKEKLMDTNERFEHHRTSAHSKFEEIDNTFEEHSEKLSDHDRRISNLEVFNGIEIKNKH